MKPTLHVTEPKSSGDSSARRFTRTFPSTDQSFRANSFADFGGRCSGTPGPSFRRISDDYFDNEARGHFASEAAMFGVMIAIAAVPVIEGMRGAMQFLHVVGVL